jgi:hypothetical protein
MLHNDPKGCRRSTILTPGRAGDACAPDVALAAMGEAAALGIYDSPSCAAAQQWRYTSTPPTNGAAALTLSPFAIGTDVLVCRPEVVAAQGTPCADAFDLCSSASTCDAAGHCAPREMACFTTSFASRKDTQCVGRPRCENFFRVNPWEPDAVLAQCVEPPLEDYTPCPDPCLSHVWTEFDREISQGPPVESAGRVSGGQCYGGGCQGARLDCQLFYPFEHSDADSVCRVIECDAGYTSSRTAPAFRRVGSVADNARLHCKLGVRDELYGVSLRSTSCDDGNDCSKEDQCGGTATCLPGQQRRCDDSTECRALDPTCDTRDGACRYSDAPEGVPCAGDGDLCNYYECDGFGGCRPSPRTALRSASSACATAPTARATTRRGPAVS